MSTTSVAILIVLVILFLIGRDIILWYLRINFREKQLNKVIDLLIEIKNQNKSNGIFIQEKE